MKNLMEISQLLLTIDTRYFRKENIEDVDVNSYDLAKILYKKDGITIIMATEMEYIDEYEDYYEFDYLFASGLTQDEKDLIEKTTDMIYRNRIWQK